jgi:acetoin utilization protein AcuB
MIVGMWMTRNLVTIEPGTRLVVAAALMAKHKVRRLPVVQGSAEGLHLLGLVSTTELYRAFPPDRNPFSGDSFDALEPHLTAEQVMSREVLTTTADTPIEDAAMVMRDKKIGALPVMHGPILVGLITESDVFRAFIDMLNTDSGGTRITFSISDGEDAFELLAAATRRRRIRVQSFVSSRQDKQDVCVVRMTGPEVDQAIDDLWQSRHQVLNVLRWPQSK